MKRNLQTVVLPAAIAASFLFGCSSPKVAKQTEPARPSVAQTQVGHDTVEIKSAEQSNPSVTLGRNDSVLQHFTGKIIAIDSPTREVTLQDPQGRRQTFVVDTSVQRFKEARVGDKISVDYYLGFNAEVRKPNAEEKKNPLVVLEATGRTGPEEAPAGGSARQIRAVVTIQELDRHNKTVTVKGPRGRYFVTRVKDPSRLEQVHIGDTIVLTFTEAAVVSLTPTGKEKSTALNPPKAADKKVASEKAAGEKATGEKAAITP